MPNCVAVSTASALLESMVEKYFGMETAGAGQSARENPGVTPIRNRGGTSGAPSGLYICMYPRRSSDNVYPQRRLAWCAESRGVCQKVLTKNGCTANASPHSRSRAVGRKNLAVCGTTETTKLLVVVNERSIVASFIFIFLQAMTQVRTPKKTFDNFWPDDNYRYRLGEVLPGSGVLRSKTWYLARYV